MVTLMESHPDDMAAAADNAAARSEPRLAGNDETHGPITHIVLLILLCGGLFLFRAQSLPLADPEEARCALIVRHMLRSGDWIVPYLRGQVYYDKPAPYFWLAAAGWKLTGSAELGGRLVSALAALLAVLVTYAFARRRFGSSAGLLAGVVLATSGEFLFMARWYRMDMPFAAAMWAALWWFWRYETKPGDSNNNVNRKGRWLGFYVFCAIATLFKGPAGLVLPVMVVAAYLLMSGKAKRFFELFHLSGITLYLLIAAPWYVAISMAQPGYAYEFFIQQNLARYAGHTFGRHGLPGVIYIPILLAGLLPWTIYLPGLCIRYFPRRWRLRNERPEMLFLWLAVLVPLVFFMFGRTRLANYILPVFGPLAVMTGVLLADWIVSHKPDPLMKLGAAVLFVIVLVLPFVSIGIEIWLKIISPWIAVPIGVSIIAALAMRASLRRARRARFVGWAVAAIVVTYMFLIGHAAPAAYERISTRSLARLINPAEASSVTLCYWNGRAESFAFYTGVDEVRKFSRSHPGGLRALMRFMDANRRTYCLLRGRRALNDLNRAYGGRLVVLGDNGRRWLVANPSSPASSPSGT